MHSEDQIKALHLIKALIKLLKSWHCCKQAMDTVNCSHKLPRATPSGVLSNWAVLPQVTGQIYFPESSQLKPFLSGAFESGRFFLINWSNLRKSFAALPKWTTAFDPYFAGENLYMNVRAGRSSVQNERVAYCRPIEYLQMTSKFCVDPNVRLQSE